MDKPDKNIKNAPPDKTSKVEQEAASTSKPKTRGKKRKRHDSGSSSDIEYILPENALEVETNLQNVALKNNLDDASMKKILKKVVTNDHVLALVKLREEEELALSEEQNPKPKLTRAKAKELLKEKTRSEGEALNIKEPPEDKDDDKDESTNDDGPKVTFERVLALVKLREEKETLTRAKAKELMRGSTKSAPWNLELTPIKHIPVKTRPEVKELITKELPEDEDDDEYEPTHDDVPSDDDQTLESCSDFDSQPPTPGAPLTPHSIHTSSPQVLQDGPFKVPTKPQLSTTTARRKLVIVEEEEATIALRTRSKLSLSATPIEHIESSFVPPDDVPMPIGDDLWNQFLEECLNPAETSKNEDDDEADPEYNVAADPDAHDEDEDNSILRISKKELNDLVTELFNIMPEDTTAAEQLATNLANDVLTANNGIAPGAWDGKQEPISDEEKDKQPQTEQQKRDSVSRFSIGKSEPEDPDYIVPTEKKKASGKEKKNKNAGKKSVNILVKEQNVSVQPAASERAGPPPLLQTLLGNKHTRELTLNIDSTVKILPEQVLIMQQQIRQHVQLAASNYLQLYVNPAHWNLAPKYKEYLEQFGKMVEKNPNSVVNVCNLKPALELVYSWEASVSKDTPENKAMVEFVQSEAERSRRRFAQNAMYIGNFPELYMKVIANSTVFQYPYLLPVMPYRADNNRKFGYRKPEDELIAMGLDQFWQYVEDNPEIYKRPRTHKAGRWGLVATCQLMVKHMFPWMSSKWLQYHVNRVRKNKDNPIYKFFANREVTKVEHRLLPYNPEITLYEQPEYEMPRLWVRYLAKTSKRFRYYHYKRSGTGAPPQGVPVTVDVQEPIKKPLPAHFTKTFVCNRYNVIPKTPEISQDKFDLVVLPKRTGPMLTINPLTSTNIDNVISTENAIGVGISNTDKVKPKVIVPPGKVAISDIRQRENKQNTASDTRGKLIPLSVMKLAPGYHTATFKNSAVRNAEDSEHNSTQTQSDRTLASNMFSVVQTSQGAYLMPLTVQQNTNTVNSINGPISSTAVVGNNLPEPSRNFEEETSRTSTVRRITSKPEDINGHCQCCVLMKKICKEKQSRITDFFKANKTEEKICECSHRKFPTITKRLRMLVDNFKSRSWCEQRRIRSILNSAQLQNSEKDRKSKVDGTRQKSERVDDEEYDLEDIEYVTTFHIKLTRRSNIARNPHLKTKINQIFTKFDSDDGDPVALSEEIFYAFDVDLVDLYKEFLGFLTPEQADKVDRFKDYFVHSCVGELVKKVEAEIQDKGNREAVLIQINGIFTDNVSTSCEICTGLLNTMTQYPRLAKYVFSLFPHRVVVREEERSEKEKTPKKTKSKTTSKQKSPSKPQDELEVEPLETETDLMETDPLETDPLHMETDELDSEMQAIHGSETEQEITEARLKEAEPVDNLTICDKTLVVVEFEAEESGSEKEKTPKKTKSKTTSKQKSPSKPQDELEVEPLETETDLMETDPLETDPLHMETDELDSEMQAIHGYETEQEITEARLKEAEPVDNLTICDKTLVVIEFEAEESGDEADKTKTPSEVKSDVTVAQETEEIKTEDALTREIIMEEALIEESIINKIETHDISESTVMSPLVMSEDEPETQIKTETSETIEWTREEDKFILELLLKHVTPETRKDKTILEILEENNVYQVVATKYPHKCIDDVKERVMRILDILVTSQPN